MSAALEIAARCEYCGHIGILRSRSGDGEIEIRQVNGKGRFACIDTDACDSREAWRAVDEADA